MFEFYLFRYEIIFYLFLLINIKSCILVKSTWCLHNNTLVLDKHIKYISNIFFSLPFMCRSLVLSLSLVGIMAYFLSHLASSGLALVQQIYLLYDHPILLSIRHRSFSSIDSRLLFLLAKLFYCQLDLLYFRLKSGEHLFKHTVLLPPSKICRYH